MLPDRVVAFALAVVCSMIKLFEMPMGGSVTLLSMLFIVLIAYWYGPYVGIMTAVAYGLVQFVTEPIFYTIPQMLLDYPLAFGALGLAGFFNKKKWGLQIGYVVGVFGRFIFSTISGIVFFASYAPEGMNPILYSLGYQASYLVPEAVITGFFNSTPARVTPVFIITLPPYSRIPVRLCRHVCYVHGNDRLLLWTCIRRQDKRLRRRPSSLPGTDNTQCHAPVHMP